jgi:hypothetical protein
VAKPTPAQKARVIRSLPSTTPKSFTPQTFAEAVLTRMGYHPTKLNVADLMSWEAREGGHWHNAAKYNPLNTTMSVGVCHAMNSVGVKAYSSWENGIKATCKTLSLNEAGYSEIRGALKKGGTGDFGSIVAASAWGTGDFPIDRYPTGLVREVGSGPGVAGDIAGGIGTAANDAAGAVMAPVHAVETLEKAGAWLVDHWQYALIAAILIVMVLAYVAAKLIQNPQVQAVAGDALKAGAV